MKIIFFTGNYTFIYQKKLLDFTITQVEMYFDIDFN